MKCSNCDQPLIPGARFCGKCGTLAPAANSQPTSEAHVRQAKLDEAARRITIKTDEDDEDRHVLGVPHLQTHGPDDRLDVSSTAPKPLPELAAPKPHRLLEGPHPAIAKAQKAHQAQHHTAAKPLDMRDDYEVSVVEPPHQQIPKHTQTEPDLEPIEPATPHHAAQPPRQDIPGPRYPFGHQMSDKNYFTAFLLSFFLGMFGIDRFYTGHYLYGFIKFLTFGGGTVLWYIDTILLLANLRRDQYGRRFWGRRKDFRASLWIFIGFSVLGVGLLVAAIMALPADFQI